MLHFWHFSDPPPAPLPPPPLPCYILLSIITVFKTYMVWIAKLIRKKLSFTPYSVSQTWLFASKTNKIIVQTRPVLDPFHDSSKQLKSVFGSLADLLKFATYLVGKKAEKVWESMPKAKKVYHKLRKCAKSWESVLKAEKVWRKCAKSWESLPNAKKVEESVLKAKKV